MSSESARPVWMQFRGNTLFLLPNILGLFQGVQTGSNIFLSYLLFCKDIFYFHRTKNKTYYRENHLKNGDRARGCSFLRLWQGVPAACRGVGGCAGPEGHNCCVYVGLLRGTPRLECQREVVLSGPRASGWPGTLDRSGTAL